MLKEIFKFLEEADNWPPLHGEAFQTPCTLHLLMGFCTNVRSGLSTSAISLLNTVMVKFASNSNRSVVKKWLTYRKAYEITLGRFNNVVGIRFGKTEQNAISLGTL